MTDAPMLVKVKPLVWEEVYDSHPWGWKARCAIMGGFYYADNDAEKQEQDALRAARILAALDMTPDPRVAALVKAAEALGVRKMVAGWNGEDRETPYTPHPPHLWAKITTTCGAVYALDAALAAFKEKTNE